MSTGFNDPIKSKKHKEMKSPWNFDCPKYDERSSCYVNAGSHYGVGHRQPVGHAGEPKKEVSTLPFGRPKTMQDDAILKTNLRFETEM